MKLRVVKANGEYSVESKSWFLWKPLFDYRVGSFVRFDKEQDAIKFVSRYSSFLETETVVTIESKLIKEKFPQYFI